MMCIVKILIVLLADRTIGRAFGTLCRLSDCLSVCLSSVTFCIQAKRLDLPMKFSGKVWTDHGTT